MRTTIIGLSAAALLLLFAGTACIVDDVGIEESDVYTCQTEDDCVSGFYCVENKCVKDAPIDCRDEDGDGIAGTGSDCSFGVIDCNDSDDSIHPADASLGIAAAPELCDLKDNDCDDLVDEEIEEACPLTLGVCGEVTAIRTCVDGQLYPASCDEGCPGPDCIYGPDYAFEEGSGDCGDEKDNDCDGQTDTEEDACPLCTEGLACNPSPGIGCMVTGGPTCACQPGTTSCADDGSQQCLDASGNPTIGYAEQLESCGNGIDDDCDGDIDEDC